MKTKNKIILVVLLLLIFLTISFLVYNKNTILMNFDYSVKTFIENHNSPTLYGFMLSVTKIGDVYEALVIFLVFGLFLYIKDKKYFYSFVLSSSLGILLSEAIKYIVVRIRPSQLIEHDYSFPSVHATMSTIFLLSSVYLLFPHMQKGWARNLFITLVSIIFPLIALSRIYLSVHWASDVIAGIILGSICFIFSMIVCCRKKKNVL